jgi:hypothetical protein
MERTRKSRRPGEDRQGRSDSGRASGDGRGQVKRAAGGVGAPASLHNGRSEDANAPDRGLWNSGLAATLNETDQERFARYQRLRLKAEAALEELCEDAGAPPNVRAAAARTLLELTGAIGARKREEDQDHARNGLDPEALTLDDIDREISRIGEV